MPARCQRDVSAAGAAATASPAPRPDPAVSPAGWASLPLLPSPLSMPPAGLRAERGERGRQRGRERSCSACPGTSPRQQHRTGLSWHCVRAWVCPLTVVAVGRGSLRRALGVKRGQYPRSRRHLAGRGSGWQVPGCVSQEKARLPGQEGGRKGGCLYREGGQCLWVVLPSGNCVFSGPHPRGSKWGPSAGSRDSGQGQKWPRGP